MNLKSLILSLLLLSSAIANDEFTIKPEIDMQLRYEYKDKEYSTLGQSLYHAEDDVYDEYILGGELGLKASYLNYDFVAKIHGLAKIKNSDQNMQEHEHEIASQENFVGYGYMGDLHIGGHYNGFKASIGRQTYSSRLVGANEEVTVNSYEGIYLEYEKDKFKIDTFYFNKIASSPLAYVVNKNHSYGVLGYGMGYNVGKYTKLSEHILGVRGAGKYTKGAINTKLKYGTQDTNIKIENLYVDNFFNTLSLRAKYNLELGGFDVNTKVGMVTQNEVGANNFEENIDATLYQGMLKLSYSDFFISYKLSSTDTNTDAAYSGTIISPFSATLAWIYGPKTAHAFIADTFSQQLSIMNVFYIDKLPLRVIASHILYEIGEDNGLPLLRNMPTPATDTRETYIDAKAYFSKRLSLSAQYSFATNITPIVGERKNIKLYLEYAY